MINKAHLSCIKQPFLPTQVASSIVFPTSLSSFEFQSQTLTPISPQHMTTPSTTHHNANIHACRSQLICCFSWTRNGAGVVRTDGFIQRSAHAPPHKLTLQHGVTGRGTHTSTTAQTDSATWCDREGNTHFHHRTNWHCDMVWQGGERTLTPPHKLTLRHGVSRRGTHTSTTAQTDSATWCDREGNAHLHHRTNWHCNMVWQGGERTLTPPHKLTLRHGVSRRGTHTSTTAQTDSATWCVKEGNTHFHHRTNWLCDMVWQGGERTLPPPHKLTLQHGVTGRGTHTSTTAQTDSATWCDREGSAHLHHRTNWHCNMVWQGGERTLPPPHKLTLQHGVTGRGTHTSTTAQTDSATWCDREGNAHFRHRTNWHCDMVCQGGEHTLPPPHWHCNMVWQGGERTLPPPHKLTLQHGVTGRGTHTSTTAQTDTATWCDREGNAHFHHRTNWHCDMVWQGGERTLPPPHKLTLRHGVTGRGTHTSTTAQTDTATWCDREGNTHFHHRTNWLCDMVCQGGEHTLPPPHKLTLRHGVSRRGTHTSTTAQTDSATWCDREGNAHFHHRTNWHCDMVWQGGERTLPPPHKLTLQHGVTGRGTHTSTTAQTDSATWCDREGNAHFRHRTNWHCDMVCQGGEHTLPPPHKLTLRHGVSRRGTHTSTTAQTDTATWCDREGNTHFHHRTNWHCNVVWQGGERTLPPPHKLTLRHGVSRRGTHTYTTAQTDTATWCDREGNTHFHYRTNWHCDMVWQGGEHTLPPPHKLTLQHGVTGRGTHTSTTAQTDSATWCDREGNAHLHHRTNWHCNMVWQGGKRTLPPPHKLTLQHGVTGRGAHTSTTAQTDSATWCNKEGTAIVLKTQTQTDSATWCDKEGTAIVLKTQTQTANLLCQQSVML